MERLLNTWVIVPAYNEAAVLGEVLPLLLSVCPNIVVVDDGSQDSTPKIARQHAVHLIRHSINLGQGAALQTGLAYACRQKGDYFVTFDADGQMEPHDMIALCAPLEAERVDVTLGSRFLTASPLTIPASRRWLLKASTLFTTLTSGLSLTDVHNGFRAFSRMAAERIQLQHNRMAHASEILYQIAQLGLSYQEVPVSIRYTPYSLKKGQRSLNSLNILWDLFFQ